MRSLVNFIGISLSLLLMAIVSGGAQAQIKPENKSPNTAELQFLIGTYTQADESAPFASKGIYSLSFDKVTGTFNHLKLAGESINPSFGVLNESSGRFYAVNENAVGEVTSFDFTKDNLSLTPINSVLAQGSYPCYIAMSPDKSMLAIANYGTGTTAIYAIDKATGSIGKLIHTIKHTGTSANAERQEGPHAHWVQWDKSGVRLYVVDLGIDKVMMYEQDTNWQVGKVALALQPGAGSRHMVFHPMLNLSYVLNELNNTILAAEIGKDGHLKPIQQVDMLPVSNMQKSQGGHIAISPDGKYLYASNRGHNSIVVYQLSEQGKLTHLQTISSGGEWPRFFLISADQGYLFVAHQHSHNIVPFIISANGKLSQLESELKLPAPVFMQELAQ